jgi:hypothetical protein
MSKSIFLFIPAIFIVLLLTAISGKYQLVPKSIDLQPVYTEPASPTPTPVTPTPVPPEWVEITNQEKRFSFNAPRSWNFDGTVLRNYTDDQAKPKMGFPENSIKCDFVVPSDSSIKIINQIQVSSRHELSIVRGTIYYSDFNRNGPGFGDSIVYQISNNSGRTSQLLCFAFAESLSSTVDQILSTFKFLPTSTPAWQTYRNDQYGFEFQHPIIGKPQPIGGPVLLALNIGNITISVQNFDDKDLRKWLISTNALPLNNSLSTHVQESVTTVGGLSAIKITTPVNGGRETVYVTNNKYLYEIDFGFPDNPTQMEYDSNKAIFTQILSTFKFIDQ